MEHYLGLLMQEALSLWKFFTPLSYCLEGWRSLHSTFAFIKSLPPYCNKCHRPFFPFWVSVHWIYAASRPLILTFLHLAPADCYLIARCFSIIYSHNYLPTFDAYFRNLMSLITLYKSLMRHLHHAVSLSFVHFSFEIVALCFVDFSSLL